jgi:plastocyanin
LESYLQILERQGAPPDLWRDSSTDKTATEHIRLSVFGFPSPSAAGTYAYHCTIHAGMADTITVQ